MKRFSFSMLALAGLLFTACSDNDAVVGNDPKPGDTRSDGYVALSISLPTTSMTRATNDNFDDGTADEYKVSDCALLLFEGTSESTAQLLSVQSCTYDEFLDEDGADVTDDNITSTYKVKAKVSGHNPELNLYALAMLNYQNFLEIPTNGNTFAIKNHADGQNGSLTLKSENVAGTTFATLRGITTSPELSFQTVTDTPDPSNPYSLTSRSTGGTKDYFFMTNAVMSTVPGGSNATLTPSSDYVFQLAQLDPTKIYRTPEEAAKDPAGEIFVERAVAKATLFYSAQGVGSTTMTIQEVSWAIDNMEPATFVFRNPSDATTSLYNYWAYASAAGTKNYRFISHTSTYQQAAIDGTSGSLGSDKDYYRTYWCIDPQYEPTTPWDYAATTPVEGTTYPKMNRYDAFLRTGTSSAAASTLYCTENTFPVIYQDYINTTRAIIKVKVDTDNKPFYTYNGGKTPIDQTAAQKYFIANIINNVNVQTAIKNALGEDKTISVTEDNFSSIFEIAYTDDNNAGEYEITSLTFKPTGDYSTKFIEGANLSSVLKQAMDTANKEVHILQYVDGVMYYEARFQHFGDELTPWNKNEYGDLAPAGGSTAAAYPANGSTTAEMNYLGRYGMVRNNWYEVEVTKFTGLGSPTVPTFDASNYGTPDDDLVDNIAVKIHVLSWAKRTQQWEF